MADRPSTIARRAAASCCGSSPKGFAATFGESVDPVERLSRALAALESTR